MGFDKCRANWSIEVVLEVGQMSIVYGRHQGNRSEYLAVPTLAKLGFVVPVPRQEDHFGVDFIVHLARLDGLTVHPAGKSFAIQIKSNADDIAVDSQPKRDSLFNTSLPFFVGVVSRESLTLKIYSTLNRIRFYWMRGDKRDFKLKLGYPVDSSAPTFPKPHDFPKPHHEKGLVWTGKPILDMYAGEPEDAKERLRERTSLQSTVESWINLENQALSLKEQGVPLVYWPTYYETNEPIQIRLPHMDGMSYSCYASQDSFPNICCATLKTLVSLKFYLKKLKEDGSPMASRLEQMERHLRDLETDCEKFSKT